MRTTSSISYAKDMKRLILTAAFLLTIAGARSPIQKFQSPAPLCPPNCGDGGNIVSMVR